MGWIYYIGLIFKTYMNINLGVSLIQLGIDCVVSGLKLLVV